MHKCAHQPCGDNMWVVKSKYSNSFSMVSIATLFISTCSWFVTSTSIQNIFCWQGCKKGRYTYEKKLSDLQEINSIKTKAESSPDAKQDSSEASSPVDIDENGRLQTICQALASAFQRIFIDVAFYHQSKSALNNTIQRFLSQQGITRVTAYMRYSDKPSITSQESLFSRMCEINSLMLSLSLSETEKNSSVAKQKMWEIMSQISESVLLKCCDFAKQIPGFSDIAIDDRMVLLRSAFGELLLATQFFFWKSDINAYIKVQPENGEIHFIPYDYLEKMVVGGECMEKRVRCVKSDKYALLLCSIFVLTISNKTFCKNISFFYCVVIVVQKRCKVWVLHWRIWQF